MHAPFRITGHLFKELDCLVVEIGESDSVGRGEAAGVYYLKDTPAGAMDQIQALIPELEKGLDRQTLQTLLPAGGARNAIDCALWDLECKLAGQSVWQRTKATPRELTTCQTIGVMPTLEATAAAAIALKGFELIKLKLNGDAPIDRVRSVRKARPDVRLIVDANQGLTLPLLEECLPEFAKAKVELVEQPLPRGGDAGIETIEHLVPIAADESCLHRGELAEAAKRYDVINIKLDKTGGLTEALLFADEILARGLNYMVGNMLGTSLAMAPAFVVALNGQLADLDGPVALKSDRIHGLTYRTGRVSPFTSALWG
jgi:L-alanine-DL-glutamate epimerase-like enolase superfamily enzyme